MAYPQKYCLFYRAPGVHRSGNTLCKLSRETGRTLETRLEEHNGEARRRTVDKPWGDHMRAKHAGINLGVGDSILSAVSVVARASDRASRKLREAVEIRNEGPEINTSAGWSLL